MILYLRIFACLCWVNVSFGSNILDSLGYVSPVDHQVSLTGNFMELRPNHFHAGIDIKSSKGVSGDPIKAVKEGYISRIKIQSGGYGNVLYINHPSTGHTSVYAHLHVFSDEVEALVKKIQYNLESFEVDMYLPDSLLLVKQAEYIGQMGNTGRSFGPHLHFEIRKTNTEEPINPEIIGFGPSDSSSPVLESLHVHELNSVGEQLDKQVKYFKNKKSPYTLFTDKIEVEGNIIGLGLQMFDRMDGSWNKNGIYGYQLKVDNKVRFSWKAHAFDFSQTRHINAFWDYERYKAQGQKVYLLYKQFCNPFSYFDSNDTGLIEIKNGESKEVQIIVIDAHKNKSVLKFTLIGKGKEEKINSRLIRCDTSFTVSKSFFKVEMNEASLYLPSNLEVKESKTLFHGQNCWSVTIGNPQTPVSKYFSISCKIPSDYNKQYTLVTTDSRGRLKQFGGDTIDNRFVAKVDELGTYYLYKDELEPKINVVSFSKSYKSPWKIKITDNLKTDGRADDMSYSARVNGQWIRMKYDQKNDLLVFDDWDILPSSPFEFELTVMDHCKNVTTYKRKI